MCPKPCQWRGGCGLRCYRCVETNGKDTERVNSMSFSGTILLKTSKPVNDEHLMSTQLVTRVCVCVCYAYHHYILDLYK